MMVPLEDPHRRLRWTIYAILIAVAAGNMTGRLLAVNSVDLQRIEKNRINRQLETDRRQLAAEGITGEALEVQLEAREAELEQSMRLSRPFLSANDRSRWMTIRALVEHGTYAIDEIVGQPTWDTIDMVQHRGRDGELHLYSSKPPLLPTILAGEYWLIHKLTPFRLDTHPHLVGRFMLLTVSILPMVLMFVVLGVLVEHLGTTDWGRIFVMAAATMGTFLTTFAVVLNNHVVAAVSVALALYAIVRIVVDGEYLPRYFTLAGFAAAFAAANELPALAFLAATAALLAYWSIRQTALIFLPAALIVAAAFFATNYIAHGCFTPPYMHRGESDPNDNWYNYTYEVNGEFKESYWNNPQGIDQGEESQLLYATHALVGHHGIFSLTPVWILSMVGILIWLVRGETLQRQLALMIGALTIICLVFYLGLRPQSDRNYGGMTSGFRWMFWFAPLWLVVMLPAVDKMAGSAFWRGTALVFLAISVLSASFPTWNPWTQPWIYQWMEASGWL
jgi:hypothetical protein